MAAIVLSSKLASQNHSIGNSLNLVQHNITNLINNSYMASALYRMADSYLSSLIVINCSVMWQFGTFVLFNKVVRWYRLGEVENVYVAYSFSHFAIYLPKLIKIGGNLTML